MLLAFPGNVRPSVRESLEPLALQRGQPAYRQSISRMLWIDEWCILPRVSH